MKIDIEFFEILTKAAISDLDELIKLNSIDVDHPFKNNVDREGVYNLILEDYQKLNFIKSDDPDLFALKMKLKEKLINLA
jgi:hypothetical protein